MSSFNQISDFFQVFFYSYFKGKEDIKFLARVFQKLLVNFTWWTNKKDLNGKNVFAGGFLGLDNIGIFDRSRQLPVGGSLFQSDGKSNNGGKKSFFCARSKFLCFKELHGWRSTVF